MHLTRLSPRSILALPKLQKNILFPVRSAMDARKKLQDVVSVDVHAAKGLLNSGHCYLDVRTTEEFNKCHIENTLNVPYMYFTQEGKFKNPEFLNQVAVLCKKEDHLVVGCQSGARSHRACVVLLNAGYEHVTEMGGGYSAWVDNGLAQGKPAE